MTAYERMHLDIAKRQADHMAAVEAFSKKFEVRMAAALVRGMGCPNSDVAL